MIKIVLLIEFGIGLIWIEMNFLKFFSTFIFAILLPMFALFSAYNNLQQLNQSIDKIETTAAIMAQYQNIHDHIANHNQYVLLTALLIENSNQKAFLTKQIMKTVVIHVGFAVFSVGLAFVIFGIDAGPIESKGSAMGFNFDFKTGSTGAGIVVIGALMMSLGGILSNQYITVDQPGYQYDGGDSSTSDTAAEVKSYYEQCNVHADKDKNGEWVGEEFLMGSSCVGTLMLGQYMGLKQK